jgi:SAM-dependent methyltransferase
VTLTTADRPITRGPEWFASWFDSVHYHRLYAHRDETEAAGFIDELIRRIRPADHADVLDLGCGAGRHSKYLASKGLRVTGIDLSVRSIRHAKAFEHPAIRFFQHDMRTPFGNTAFDYVFNFFTSFGYFEEPTEHLAVVRNMADSLKPGGRLVLDYLNVQQAERRLTREEERNIDGVIYRLKRWSDSNYFFKQIVIEDRNPGQPTQYVERVAKFTLQDFQRMFAPHGLSMEQVYGDYRLTPYDALASSRMILVARKTVHEADSMMDASSAERALGGELEWLPRAS